MKCYNHPDRDAIAVAHLTGKGLCCDCIEEYKGIVVEKNDEQTKEIIDKTLYTYEKIDEEEKFISDSKKLASEAVGYRKYTFYAYLAFAIIPILIAFDSFSTNPQLSFVYGIIGIIFFILCLAHKKYIK